MVLDAMPDAIHEHGASLGQSTKKDLFEGSPRIPAHNGQMLALPFHGNLNNTLPL